MTRKSVKSNDGSSQSETRDYMRLKTLIEGTVYIMNHFHYLFPQSSLLETVEIMMIH